MTDEVKSTWDPKSLVGKTVLYVPAKFIGKVTDFFNGVTRPFVSPINNQKVKGPVLEVNGEHYFVALESSFIDLNESEEAFFNAIQKALTGAMAEMVKVGAELKIPPPTLAMLLVGTLRTQTMALESFHKGDLPQDGTQAPRSPQAPPEDAMG
jgi:hypothetical protein